MDTQIRCKPAVELFYKNLSFLPHPAGIVRLMQFAHDSAGLRVYKRQVAEALVMLLESNGMLIFDDAIQVATYMESVGYSVTSSATSSS